MADNRTPAIFLTFCAVFDQFAYLEGLFLIAFLIEPSKENSKYLSSMSKLDQVHQNRV